MRLHCSPTRFYVEFMLSLSQFVYIYMCVFIIKVYFMSLLSIQDIFYIFDFNRMSVYIDNQIVLLLYTTIECLYILIIKL